MSCSEKLGIEVWPGELDLAQRRPSQPASNFAAVDREVQETVRPTLGRRQHSFDRRPQDLDRRAQNLYRCSEEIDAPDELYSEPDPSVTASSAGGTSNAVPFLPDPVWQRMRFQRLRKLENRVKELTLRLLPPEDRQKSEVRERERRKMRQATRRWHARTIKDRVFPVVLNFVAATFLSYVIYNWVVLRASRFAFLLHALLTFLVLKNTFFSATQVSALISGIDVAYLAIGAAIDQPKTGPGNSNLYLAFDPLLIGFVCFIVVQAKRVVHRYEDLVDAFVQLRRTSTKDSASVAGIEVTHPDGVLSEVESEVKNISTRLFVVIFGLVMNIAVTAVFLMVAPRADVSDYASITIDTILPALMTSCIAGLMLLFWSHRPKNSSRHLTILLFGSVIEATMSSFAASWLACGEILVIVHRLAQRSAVHPLDPVLSLLVSFIVFVQFRSATNCLEDCEIDKRISAAKEVLEASR